MAEAQVITQEIRKVEKRTMLQLSEDEARTLVAVLALISGCETNSPRKHTQAVLDVLRDNGINYQDGEVIDLARGEINFSNYA